MARPILSAQKWTIRSDDEDEYYDESEDSQPTGFAKYQDDDEDEELSLQNFSESEFILEYHPKFAPLYDINNPFYKADFQIYYGGRAGAKSWAIARALVLRASQDCLRIVCTREFQNSISDSVMKLLEDQIQIMGLGAEFTVLKTTIYHKHTGSQFIFKGLAKANIQGLKSLEGADLCWVEEAQVVSENSWAILTPTIRKPGSQIIVSLNPELIEDPTSQRFIINTPPGAYKAHVNYLDNIHCSEKTIRDAEWCKVTDLDAYKHVWLGEFRKASDSQIFKNKFSISSFEADHTWFGPYYGIDFGFSVDPMAVIECWISNRKLYIRRESVKVGVEVEDMEDHINRIPGIKQRQIRADSARPELTSHLASKNFNIVESKKWKGFIEDGISFMRSFEQIIIHPSCKNTEFEFKYYSYKIDRMTGLVTTDIVDKHNHCIDAIRYAIEPIITKKFMNYGSWV
jgi:phage terminase large subunit